MNVSHKLVALAAAGTLMIAAAPASAQHRGGGRTVFRGGVRIGGGGFYGSRVVRVAPVRFYRPYYAFRPRVSLGFGLWVGYPVVYPAYYGSYYGYYNPYGYYPYGAYPGYPTYPAYPGYPYSSSSYPSYPYASNYPSNSYPSNSYPQSSYPSNPYPQSGSQYPSTAYPQNAPYGSVGVRPGSTSADTGGVSFEISPSTAEVFVDGEFVGTVDQFTPSSQPLGVSRGRHQIEIRAPGFRTMSVDVDIVAGQVIPYRGQMER